MKKGPTETLERQWTLLKRIPRAPRKISTRELHEYSLREGYSVDKRTTERDLVRLSRQFPLVSESSGRTQYWFWLHDDAGLEVPGMTPAAAIVLELTREYLTALLPKSVIELLAPYSQRAESVLQGTKLSAWPKRVKAINRGPVLIPPNIDPAVRDVVNEALLDNKQFETDYHSRTETTTNRYVVNPLGLVARNGVLYLVCTLWDYEDVRQLAMHRMDNSVLLDTTSHSLADFELDNYVEKQAEFGYPRGDKPIRLRALFEAQAAYHLQETPLSEDQILNEQKDGRILLDVNVANTEELRWWLLGFGDQVEVSGPTFLRKEFKDVAQRFSNLYKE